MRFLMVEWAGQHGIPAWLIPDYWLMLTLAIVTGCLVTRRLAAQVVPETPTGDLLVAGILGLFLGSKLLYGFEFGFPADYRRLLQPAGFSLYGGLAGLLTAWALCRRLRPWPMAGFLDCAAPGLAAGLVPGRLGCFLAGCNGGVVSGLPWAVRFPPGTSSYNQQIEQGLLEPGSELSLPAQPTQLYESFFGLAAFVLLLRLLRIRRFGGEVFLTGIIWYAAFRFASEWLRADNGHFRFMNWFSFAQIISLSAAACGLFFYVSLSRRAVALPTGSPGREGP